MGLTVLYMSISILSETVKFQFMLDNNNFAFSFSWSISIQVYRGHRSFCTVFLGARNLQYFLEDANSSYRKQKQTPVYLGRYQLGLILDSACYRLEPGHYTDSASVHTYE
jgi:hypothetical protein